MESPPVLRPERTLSTTERIELIRTLNELPVSQLLELEFALDVPKGIVPPPHEMQGIRTRALLDWVEGPTGIGWDKFLDVLRDATGVSPRICQSQRLKVIIEGDFSGADSELLLKMLAEFQNKAHAPSLKISSIKSGSIELTLQGTLEDLERLRELIDSGQLAEVVGQRIKTATVISSFSKFDLSDANLSGTNLSGTNLSDANLSDANLSGANLSGANLSGINLIRADLVRADLIDTDITKAHLSDADLSGANLSGADLRGADLRGANLSGADLSDAYLGDANLSGAYLGDANLSGANLSMANLSGAYLSGANLSKAYLIGAYVARAVLGGNFGLQQADKDNLIEGGALF